MKGINILLAEDDLNLGSLLKDFLEAEGYQVVLCKDGEAALHTAQQSPFDLMLLDVMMPKMDGFSLASAIRMTNKTTPIIFLTAKSLKEDKIKGYGLGADDYITKPFDEEELLCKIKAVLKRTTPEPVLMNETVPIGAYIFDPRNQSLTCNGTLKRITEKECEILLYLVKHRNVVIKRDQMLKDLWGQNDYFLGRSLDVFITKFRKYLKDDPAIKIENVFRVGFIFNVPDKK
ncbi:MAG: response regulator transcription factor [Bacteroidetes bacterium]|nr:response regulator transcription factor [Bacteroidota bacterium]